MDGEFTVIDRMYKKTLTVGENLIIYGVVVDNDVSGALFSALEVVVP